MNLTKDIKHKITEAILQEAIYCFVDRAVDRLFIEYLQALQALKNPTPVSDRKLRAMKRDFNTLSEHARILDSESLEMDLDSLMSRYGIPNLITVKNNSFLKVLTYLQPIKNQWSELLSDIFETCNTLEQLVEDYPALNRFIPKSERETSVEQLNKELNAHLEAVIHTKDSIPWLNS